MTANMSMKNQNADYSKSCAIHSIHFTQKFKYHGVKNFTQVTHTCSQTRPTLNFMFLSTWLDSLTQTCGDMIIDSRL